MCQPSLDHARLAPNGTPMLRLIRHKFAYEDADLHSMSHAMQAHGGPSIVACTKNESTNVGPSLLQSIGKLVNCRAP
jgi:hypothetical protein